MMHSRKAFLYVPGSDPHKIEKAAAAGADCVVLDLEDGVAADSKDEARTVIAQALQTLNFGPAERAVRVNGFPSGRCEADLAAVLPAGPEAIVLPKVESAADIERIHALLLEAERSSGRAEGSTALLVIIESARAMVDLEAICRSGAASDRLQGLVFGAEDFTADMGATRTPEALELLYARSRLVLYANAFGLQAIDLVTVNFKEEAVLLREAAQGVQMGYAGKQVIHPAQIGPVQALFTPSEKELTWARHVLDEAERQAALGKGAFSVEGQMIDRPVLRRAESLLARAAKG
jgi:citrate lyase subunit beta-like protein